MCLDSDGTAGPPGTLFVFDPQAGDDPFEPERLVPDLAELVSTVVTAYESGAVPPRRHLDRARGPATGRAQTGPLKTSLPAAFAMFWGKVYQGALTEGAMRAYARSVTAMTSLG